MASSRDLESLMARMPQEDPFAMIYRGARELKAAEESKDLARLKTLDFAVGPQCIRCSKPCLDMATGKWTPMRCGGCRAVIYCGRACQVADWNQSPKANVLPHKIFCPMNKEYMKRLPYFRSVFEQFHWARMESDGTFSHDLLKARIGVLGSGPTFGYWSVPGGQKPHDDSPSLLVRDEAFFRTNRSKSYRHGEIMLAKEWPTDVEVWKLKDANDIPLLFFTDERPAPELPSPGVVKDWASWYNWRGLTFASPAAMLMDFPLSVYHLLNVLNVIDLDKTSKKRQSLVVHCLGAEVELNFLPLFSELALLLPNTDIQLVLFGKPGHDLVHWARKEYPGCIATNDIVWQYTAPRKSGGGSIKIRIHSKDEIWNRNVAQSGPLPDVMVGLNAGIMAYQTWAEVVFISTLFDIPFAVTEYAEQSADQTAKQMPIMRANYAKAFGSGTENFDKLMQPRSHSVTVNPFHRPGQRPLPVVRMPNLYNGFVIPIMTRS